MEEDKKPIEEKICKKFEEKLEELNKEDYTKENSDYWFKTLDNLKDTYEIKKMKEELKMYRDNYERGYRDSYGTNYGRRGVPGTGRRYRGEDALDEMKYHYGNYQDSYNEGNYGAKEDSSYKMTEALEKFIYAINEELEPKDKQMFKQALQEMVQKIR